MTESPPDPWSRPNDVPVQNVTPDPNVTPGPNAMLDRSDGFGPRTVRPESIAGSPTVHYGPVTGTRGGTWRARPPLGVPSENRMAPPAPIPAGGTRPASVGPLIERAPDSTAYGLWGSRVIAWLIDHVPHLVAGAVLALGYGRWLAQLSDVETMSPTPVGLTAALLIAGGVLAVLALGWSVVNRWVIAGRTGRSLGKRRAGLQLVGADTGAPVGATQAFVRDLVHLLDGLSLVGWLWPRWDERRQTLADKLMRTVVVRIDPYQR